MPGASDETFVAGAIAVWNNGFSASFKARYLGAAPLIEDNSIRSEDSWLAQAGVSYRTGPLEFTLEAFNPFDWDDADVSYFYASRLPGEPAGGIEDIPLPATGAAQYPRHDRLSLVGLAVSYR